MTTPGPVVGWKTAHWKIKVPCRAPACRRAIRAGMINPIDHGDPPSAALCFRCFGEIMDGDESAHRFEEAQGDRPPYAG